MTTKRLPRPKPKISINQFCDGMRCTLLWDGKEISFRVPIAEEHAPKNGFCGCNGCSGWRRRAWRVMRSEAPLTDWEARSTADLFTRERPLARSQIDNLNRIYERASAFVEAMRQAQNAATAEERMGRLNDIKAASLPSPRWCGCDECTARPGKVEFVLASNAEFTDEELNFVRSWQHSIWPMSRRKFEVLDRLFERALAASVPREMAR